MQNESGSPGHTLFQGVRGGGDLSQYVDAVLVVLDHSLQTARLALDSAEPGQNLVLVLVVAPQGLGPYLVFECKRRDRDRLDAFICHYEAVRALHDLGVKVAMITGDARQVAASVAKELGIDEF